MARMKVKSEGMKRSLATLLKKDEPTIDKKSYSSSMIRYLNWHSINTDIGVMRKWVATYLTENNRKKEVTIINRASDIELRIPGLLCRLQMRGDYMIAADEDKIEATISSLIKKYDVKKPKVVEKAVPTISPMEKAKIAISKHIGVIEGKIDDYLTSGLTFSTKNYIADNTLSPMAIKAIATHFSTLVDELTELLDGSDQQLAEGYSHLRRAKQKRFQSFVKQIVLDCDSYAPPKKERKPRAKKVKPATAFVKKVRYKESDEELKLVSEKPEKLIGATECILYNTEKRLLIRLVSDSTFTVKGTTIQNVDAEKSGAKILRKPAEALSNRFTKRSSKTMFDSIKAKTRVATGRLNEHMIIIGVY